MSTISEPLKYLWLATFADRHEIMQPANDQSSKHVEGAEHNPSAFRDVIDYMEGHELLTFALINDDLSDDYWYVVNLHTGEFATGNNNSHQVFSLEDTPLTDRKVIFFRQVRQHIIGGVTQPPQVARYILGYEGKNAEGKNEKKVIYIDG